MKFLIAVAVAALVVTTTGPASAVTVKNNSKAEFTIGVDFGDKEKIETIAAGKSVEIDCKDGCGVTGPWGFSWMASGDDVIASNGVSLVSVQEPPAKK